jgi:hypothetical protein
MLWQKAWLETRSRFLIGLVLIVISALGIIYNYRATQALMPIARAIDPATIDAKGPLAGAIREGLEVQRDFRGYVWFQWYRQNLTNLMVIFAALLGSGGLLSRSLGGTLFTLSLPVSRERLIHVRAGLGLAEVLALAMVPSLLLPLCGQAIGESYRLLDVLAHGACIFVVSAVFFSLATLLSTEFADVWRPLLITCLVAVMLAMFEYVPAFRPFGIFRVMNGETYFRQTGLPWIGLLVNAGIAAALLRAAAVNLARRDF